MKIILDTVKRNVRETRMTRKDRARCRASFELDIVGLLAVALKGNAQKFYHTEETQRMFVKLVCGQVLKSLGDSSMFDEVTQNLVKMKEEHNYVL